MHTHFSPMTSFRNSSIPSRLPISSMRLLNAASSHLSSLNLHLPSWKHEARPQDLARYFAVAITTWLGVHKRRLRGTMGYPGFNFLGFLVRWTVAINIGSGAFLVGGAVSVQKRSRLESQQSMGVGK